MPISNKCACGIKHKAHTRKSRRNQLPPIRFKKRKKQERNG